MDWKRTQEAKKLLTSQGYAWNYLDTWQPRVLYFWHRPRVNIDRIVVQPAGTELPQQPGHPDHATRLARRGLLQWPPSKDCICKGCRERDWTQENPFEPVGSIVEASWVPISATGEDEEETPVKFETHIHKYAGGKVGAPCKYEGCTAQRAMMKVKRGEKRAPVAA
jgi:hypothetical protein